MSVPQVEVVVSGVRNGSGTVRVGLFVEAGFKRFGGEPVVRKGVPASEGTVRVVFEDVAPGFWAAGAYHDENDNGRLDLTMGGTAAEGRGYSRVAKPGIQAPTFAEACVEVGAEPLELPISLRYPR